MGDKLLTNYLKLSFIVLITIGVIVYPFLVYLALSHNMTMIILVLISLMLLNRVYQGFRTKRYFRSLILLLVLLSLLFAGNWLTIYAAKLIPSLINVSLALMFADTIWQGTPIIERIARLEDPNMPEEVFQYARRLTGVWVLYFSCQTLITLVLAHYAGVQLWAIYNGFIIYIMLLLMFAIEFVYRKRRFQYLAIPSPLTTIKCVIQNRDKIWTRSKSV